MAVLSTSRRLCVLLLVTFAAAPMHADLIVVDNLTGYGSTHYASDAGYPGPNNSIVNSSALQQFNAPIGGPVTRVATLVRKWEQGETQPLKVSILRANGSLPGALLGTISVPAGQITYGVATETTFDFSTAGVELQAGESYFVAFTVDIPAPQLARYRLSHVWTPGATLGYSALTGRNQLQGTYLGGGPSNSTTGEIALRISVLPEPSTLALAAALGLLALPRCRPQRHPRPSRS